MKYILKITVFIFALLPFISCTNDKDPVVQNNAFEVRQDAAYPSPSVLLHANDNDVFAKLVWDETNNGMPSVSKYTVLISDHDADPNFTNAIEYNLDLGLVVVDGDGISNCTIKVSDINAILNRLPSFNCGVMNIDIRIKSKLGVSSTNSLVQPSAFLQYSKPLTLAVTAYSTKAPALALARDTDSPATSPKLVASSYLNNNDYEGFVYLEVGSYKFYQPDSCNDYASATVYGISSGALVQDGTNGYSVATAGFYFIKVNLSATANADTGVGASSFSINPFTSIGVFGNATKATLFAGNNPMTYDSTTKKWKITWQLINGKKFSFRAVNGATTAAVLVGSGTASTTTPSTVTVPFAGVVVETTGTIKAPGDFVDNTTKTKYDIELDVNTPRKYTFTMTVNPN